MGAKKDQFDAQVLSTIDGQTVRHCKFCQTSHAYTSEFWHFHKTGSVSCKARSKELNKQKQSDPARMARSKQLKSAWAKEKRKDPEWLAKEKANKKYDWKRQYQAEKAKIQKDPVFAAYKRVRQAIYSAIFRFGTSKSKRTEEMLGCTKVEFLTYLQSKMQPGMTIGDKTRTWHIDHVCPVSQARSEEEMVKLQHYTNLNPVFVTENLIKSNKKTLEAEKMCKLLLGREWIEG